MEDQNLHYRNILLFYFKKGKNAPQAFNKVCSVYGKDAISLCSCQRWFEKFRSGNLLVNNSSRTGRPTEIDTDKIKVLLDENPYSTARDIADDLQISHTSVLNHIHKIGYVSRLNVWVPHALTKAQLARRTDICDSLIRREKNHPFLKSLVAGDIIYEAKFQIRGAHKN